MPRPKKAPRERLQITLPKPQGKALRKFCKKKDRELSEVISAALEMYLSDANGIPQETRAVLFSRVRPRAEKESP